MMGGVVLKFLRRKAASAGPKKRGVDYGILVFENTSEVIRAENTLKGAGWSTETLKAMDALLDAIKAKTDTIGAGVLVSVSPVLSSDDVEIVAGADYDSDDGMALAWTITNSAITTEVHISTLPHGKRRPSRLNTSR